MHAWVLMEEDGQPCMLINLAGGYFSLEDFLHEVACSLLVCGSRLTRILNWEGGSTYEAEGSWHVIPSRPVV
jgi:hypothetical protein